MKMDPTILAYTKCLSCGSLFKPYRPYQKYCSDECRLKVNKVKYRYVLKKTRAKVCIQCGKHYLSNDSKRKYCSDKCCQDANFYIKTKKHKMICPVCGEDFVTAHYAKKYCSNVCYVKARDKRTEEKRNAVSKLKRS